MISWAAAVWALLGPGPAVLAPLEPHGSFQRIEAARLNWSRPHQGELAYESGITFAGTGSIQSGPFVLPGAIHFYLSGFPSRPAMRVYLADGASHETLALRQRNEPSLGWVLHYWKIPREWVGRTVRLVAEDKGTGPADWLGITPPQAGGEPLAISLARAGSRNALLVWEGVLFLIPGLAAAALLCGRRELGLLRLFSVVLGASATGGYAAFWVFLASAPVGRWFSRLVELAAAVILWRYGKRLWRLPARQEAVACLALTFMAAAFYHSLGYLYITDSGATGQAQVRYNRGFMPPDNGLQEMLASRLYANEAPKPVLFGYWHSSDRPPLQGAISLFLFSITQGTEDLRYQLLGIFLQCLWIPGLWAGLRAAGIANRYLVPILGFCIFSLFCSFHSFYVWPKLISAAFCLLGLGFVIRNKWDGLDSALAALTMALALLSHTGALLTLLPIGLFALVKLRGPNRRGWLIGAGIALLLLLPWRWYQTVYDPPGDLMLKQDMTGIDDPARLMEPFPTLLAEGYRDMTPRRYLAGKLENVHVLFAGGDMDGLLRGGWRDAIIAYQSASFFHLFWAIGVLNLGFVARFFVSRRTLAVRRGDLFLLLVLSSFPPWFLLLYSPGATTIHQWALANVLLIFAALTIYLVEAWPRAVAPLLALQVCGLFVAAVLAKPAIELLPGAVYDGTADPGMASCAAASFLALVWWLARVKLQEAHELST